MSDALIIGLNRESALPHWVRIRDDGRPVYNEPQRGWPSQDILATAGRTVLVVPGEHVLLTHTQLPRKRTKQVLQAVPYAVEETLAEDISLLHFSLGKTVAEDEDTSVAVCRSGLMTDWLEQCQQHHVSIDAVHADWDFDPSLFNSSNDSRGADDEAGQSDNNRVYGVVLDSFTAMIGPHEQRVSVPTDKLGAYASAISEEPIAMQMVIGRDQPVPELNLPENTTTVEVEAPLRVSNDPWMMLAQQLATNGHGINLLQGEFSRKRQWLQGLSQWRPVAILAAVWLTVVVVSDVLHTRELKHTQVQLDTTITETFATAFPELGDVEDPVRAAQQWQSQQGGPAADGGPDLLDVLAALGTAAPSLPEVKTEAITLSQNTTELTVSAPSSAQLEQLQQRLSERPDFEVEIRGLTTREQRTQAQLRINFVAADLSGDQS